MDTPHSPPAAPASDDTLPHARCPCCDGFFSLLPEAGHAGWERATLLEWARLRPAMLLCLGCWTPLLPGHRVLLRRRPLAAPVEVAEGTEGVVQQVLGRGLLLVKFGAVEFALTRDGLSYVQGQAARIAEQPQPERASHPSLPPRRARRTATA